MPLLRCPEGHTFDPAQSAACPICGAIVPRAASEDTSIKETAAPASPAPSSPLKEDAGKLLRAGAQTAAKASQVGLAVAGKAATVGAKGAATGARWIARLPWGLWFSSLGALLGKFFTALGLKGVAAALLVFVLAGGAWWWWAGTGEVRIVRFEFPSTVALGETANGYVEYKNAQGGLRKVFVKVLHLDGRTMELAPAGDGLAQGMLPLRLKASDAGANQYEIRLMDAKGRLSESATLTVKVEGRRAQPETARGDAPFYGSGGSNEGTRSSGAGSARERPTVSVTVPATGEQRGNVRFEFGGRSSGDTRADSSRPRGIDLSN